MNIRFNTFDLLAIVILFSSLCKSSEIHYNIADPECTGPFGLCTQEDKDTLGYLAVKKLHAKMDEDSDGQVEVQETKEFMKEELQYKNGAVYSERQKKFHGSDLLISVDEMWKSWKYSQAYNMTTDHLVVWLIEYVKLPQYAENFKRNRIDGQFLPRLAINENNYYSNVMQIKDSRHRRLLMIKATDLVLFGQQHKPHNLIKDILMISALTMSIFVCIYLYTKHRQSLEQIKKMLVEFEKLSDIEDGTVVNQIKNNLSHHSSLFTFNLRKNSDVDNYSMIKNESNPMLNRLSHRKENQLMSEKNAKLTRELSIVKQEADHLRKARESADGQLLQLKLAEQELDKVRNALKQTETRLDLIKYQAPVNLINLLNRTFESEKELLDYKFKLIDKEKESCVDSLKKVCKRQSGLLGALKIAHSSTLEDIQHKLEILTRELKKLHAEKHELNKRWNNIFDLCSATSVTTSSSFDNGSQDLPLITLDNGLFLPRRIRQTNNSIDNDYSSVKQTVYNNNNNKLNQVRNANFLKNLNNSYTANAEEIINDQQIETVVTKILSQSSSFASMPSVSTQKIASKQNSVDNFHELETQKTIIQTNSNPKIDDSNNNNISLVNLNDKNAPNTTIIQQTALQSFIIKNSPDTNVENTNKVVTNIVTSPRVQKIARDSLIHKNDVFQFDDVESVKTSDMFFKSTPQSSFESDDTCKSSVNLNQNGTKLKKNKDLTSSFRKRNGFFAPLTSSSSTRLKKSVTSSKIDSSEAPVRLERSNTFTRHLSSLRRIFNQSKQNVKSSSQTNIAIDTTNQIADNIKNVNNNNASVQSIPVIINATNNKKQLTISVNNNNKDEEMNQVLNNINETQVTNGKVNLDVISIPLSNNSNTSFTIRSRSDDNLTETNTTNNKIEKKSRIFNLKFGKNKKNKTKN